MFKHSLSLTFLVLTFSNLLVLGQVDSLTVEKVSIINAKHKVEGIYKTFDEFRRNQPFYTDSFTVLPFGRDDKVLINARNDELVYRNQEGQLKQQGAQRFFGYCKNDSVFLSTVFTPQTTAFTVKKYDWITFCPIVELEHLSIIQFKKHIGAPITDSLALVPGIPFPVEDKPHEKLYMLDFLNGDFYPVKTAALLTKFELWDKELYEEYRNVKRKERKKLEVRLEFIRKFNERNPIRF